MVFAIEAIFVAIAALIVGLGISHAGVRKCATEIVALRKEAGELKEWIAEIQMFLEEGIEDE